MSRRDLSSVPGRLAVLDGDPAYLRFVRITVTECELAPDEGNVTKATELRTPQEIRLKEGVVMIAGGPGDTAVCWYIEGGKLVERR